MGPFGSFVGCIYFNQSVCNHLCRRSCRFGFIRDTVLVGAVATVVLTGLYTVLGGMRAVVYTETIQAIVLVLGAGVLTYLGMDAVGGWNELKTTVGADYFNMWRPNSDPDYPCCLFSLQVPW